MDQLISSRLNSILEKSITQDDSFVNHTSTPRGNDIKSTPSRGSSSRVASPRGSDRLDGSTEAGSRDCKDSSEVPPAICAGAAVEETNQFYQEVCIVLDESLSRSQRVDQSPVTRSSAARKRLPKSDENDVALSPSSNKFLSEVKSALES